MVTYKNLRLVRNYAYGLMPVVETTDGAEYNIDDILEADFSENEPVKYKVFAVETHQTADKIYKYYVLKTLDDNRQYRWYKQLHTKGWCAPDNWNLDDTICEFILNHLNNHEWQYFGWPDNRFGNDRSECGNFLTKTQIHQIITDIKTGIKAYLNNCNLQGKEKKKWRKAKYLLYRYFEHLWD